MLRCCRKISNQLIVITNESQSVYYVFNILMYQLDNPISCKIKKVKHSFKTSLNQQSEVSSPKSSRTSKEFRISDSQVIPFTSRKTNIMSPRGDRQRQSQRLKAMQKKMQIQRDSINFYLGELNRREEHFCRKMQQMQNDYSVKLNNMEKLLRIEVNKNIKLQQEMQQTKDAKRRNFSSNKELNYEQFTNEQLYQLMIEVQKQLSERCKSQLQVGKTAHFRKKLQMNSNYLKTNQDELLPRRFSNIQDAV